MKKSRAMELHMSDSDIFSGRKFCGLNLAVFGLIAKKAKSN